MAGLVNVRINADEIIHDIDELVGAIGVANRSAVARIREGLRDIIIGTYNEAVNEAGDGFSPIYENHLRHGILSLQPEVTATDFGLEAQYYEISSLGDFQDLQEGFHYHAILQIPDKKAFSVSSPARVELPYGGEELYNDFDQRYDFWQALVDGADFEIHLGAGKSSHSKTISTAGLYDQTLQARVNWWGGRYPEWLLLEYGVEYYPSIPPTHFSFLTEERVYEYMYNVYESVLNAVADTWEQPIVRRNSAGQLINDKGQFVKYLPNELRR
jgi:hypothetical protein